MSLLRIPCLAAALAVVAWACSDQPLASRPAAGLSVTPSELRVEVGASVTLHASALDAWGDPTDRPRVLFWSDRPDVASVDSLTGVVTGIVPGTARIAVSAPPQGVVVPVTVEARGGTEVASFGLEHVGRCERCTWPPDVMLDTWSLNTSLLRFHAENAAGVSLCGMVPLSFEADSALVAARYAPPAAGACLITLLPRSAGQGWLRVRAGQTVDSVLVVVSRTRYRWTFGPTTAGLVRTVGSTLEFELTVVGEDGSPVSGVPASFGFGDPRVYQSSRTGSDGAARWGVTLPTSSVKETLASACGPGYTPFPEFPPTFEATVSSPLPDSSYLSASVKGELRPDAPHHLQPIVVRSSFSSLPNGSSAALSYIPANRDSLVLESYYRSGVQPGPHGGPYSSEQTDQLGVIVADRYGNPTDAEPQVYSPDGAARVAWMAQYFEAGYSSLGTGCTSYWYRVTPAGRVAVIDLGGVVGPVAVTISRPGLPSRTIVVSRVQR